MGAVALFGEKYGTEVRVVEVGEYSRELCGGTHVARSGQLGLVKLLGESSIGSNVRRVEALVGIDAFRFLARESVLVSQLGEQLKARPEELPERISNMVTRLRDAERELNRLRAAQLLESSGQIASAVETIGGIAFVAHRVPDGTDADSMRKLALDGRSKIPGLQPTVVALIGTPADRPVGRGADERHDRWLKHGDLRPPVEGELAHGVRVGTVGHPVRDERDAADGLHGRGDLSGGLEELRGPEAVELTFRVAEPGHHVRDPLGQLLRARLELLAELADEH